MPSRCLGGRALAVIPPGLVGQGNSSSEKVQGPVRQQAQQGPTMRASSILCDQGSSPERQGRTGIIPLCSALFNHIWVLHPMLGSCSTGKILKNWSEFNRCHREGQGLKHLLCEEQAAELGLIQPRAEMASGAHLSSPQYLQGGNSRGRARLFTAACDGRVRDNRQKLKLERFKLGMKKFFSLLGQPSSGAG